MSEFSFVKSITVGNTLGECILWNERSRDIWWTDIHESTLHRLSWPSCELEQYRCPERLCSFGFTADDRRLVCAFESGFALYEPASGAVEWLFRPERDYRGTRFNDGRVDRAGRFWAGTMVEAPATGPDGASVTGSLYRLAGGRGERVLGGIEISNSLCFSRDGARLYFADSPTGCIRAWSMDPATGTLADESTFATVRGDGAPDGSTIDADGFLWNAQWGGSKAVRYTPGGAIDRELELPVSQPTCLCFGGEALDLLFISTARENLDPSRLDAEPEAGNVLIYATPCRGLAESRYRI